MITDDLKPVAEYVSLIQIFLISAIKMNLKLIRKRKKQEKNPLQVIQTVQIAVPIQKTAVATTLAVIRKAVAAKAVAVVVQVRRVNTRALQIRNNIDFS